MKLSFLWFFLLAALLGSQLGRHFWGEWSYVWGLKVDYLSLRVYLTDILVLVMMGFWGWEKLRFKVKSSCQRRAGKVEDLALGVWRGFLRERGKGWRGWGEENWRSLIFFGGLLTAVGINVVGALRPEVAIYGWWSWLVVGGLGWYVARNDVGRLLGWGLVVGLSLNLVLAVLQMVGGRSVGGGWWWLGERSFSLSTIGIAKWEAGGGWWLRPYGTFSHPNALGGFGLVSLAILLGLNLEKRVKRWGLGAAVVLVGVSMSQVAWMGLGLLGLAKWWLGRKWGSDRVRRWAVLGMFLLLSTIGSVGILGICYEGMSWERRQVLARSALEIFKENPVKGVGMGNFTVALAEVLPRREVVYFFQPVHNGWWLVMAELGTLGVIAVFLIGVVFAKRGVKYSKEGVWLAFGLTIWLLTWDHYVLTLQQNQLLLGVMLGLLARKGLKDDKRVV